jgi:flagellar biosynthesis protein FlhA
VSNYAAEETKSGVRSEVTLGLGVIGMIFILIIPLPPMILDAMIAVNIAFAMLVLLISLGTREALELSTYPTLLLLTTLFRLALNVASTRLILLQGQAGSVIQSFGDFVVGGDLVVGVIIFAILVIIQFIVITKGSGRISEVAARFTLDAMPGKQMAIDADLNSGLITEAEARERREKIAFEAEFYGSMDGASKFVRGDAVAGLIINVVNVIGGVIIGMGGGLTVTEALKKYSILTIGDGLVSQIPALIIAVSAGLLVTKTSSKQQFSAEFAGQLLGNHRAMATGAAVMLMLAVVPGFPKIPFILMALGLFVMSRRLKARGKLPAEENLNAAETPPEDEDGPELNDDQLRRLLEVDRMGIEVGFRLISLVDANRKGGLLDHIGMIRKQFARDLGLVVPPIRMKDNLGLDANAYRIMIAGQEVARGEIYPDHVLAMNPGTATEEIPGIRGEDPTFGLPATWVREDRRADAELAGYTVVDATSVLVTHLTETIRRHGPEILGRQDVQSLLDRVKETESALVEELVPDLLGAGEIQSVLQELLAERIPIKNLPAILEVLADNAKKTRDPAHLTELVRQRLGRTITAQKLGSDGALRAIIVDPQLENALEAEAAGRDAGAEPVPLAVLRERAMETYGEAMKHGHEPVILVRATVRRHLAELLAGLEPRLPVLSYNEVTTARRIEPVGQLGLTSPVATPAAAQAAAV